MRELPWELPRRWPCSKRSSSATDRPRRARCQAVADPMAPAPTTTTSTRRMPGAGSAVLEERRRAGHVAVLEQGVERRPMVEVAVEEVHDAVDDGLGLD